MKKKITNQRQQLTGRTLQGVVVSDKMNKTVVVKVSRLKKHPKYKKYFRVTKKYQAHDEKEEINIGDTVLIKEVRPLSKNKRWIVLRKVKAAILKETP